MRVGGVTITMRRHGSSIHQRMHTAYRTRRVYCTPSYSIGRFSKSITTPQTKGGGCQHENERQAFGNFSTTTSSFQRHPCRHRHSLLLLCGDAELRKFGLSVWNTPSDTIVGGIGYTTVRHPTVWVGLFILDFCCRERILNCPRARSGLIFPESAGQKYPNKCTTTSPPIWVRQIVDNTMVQ